MATQKVGIYRKYHGSIPTDKSGKQLPQSDWLKKRPFRWAVRWYGSDGKRYSKSFKTRKEAERHSEKKQSDVRQGKADPPPTTSLRDYFEEHRAVMHGNLAKNTLHLHLTTMEQLADSVGWNRQMGKISVRDIEKFRAGRLKTGISPSTANKEIKTLRRIFNLAILREYLPKDGNPCSGIPMLRVAPKRPPYVSADDFESMYRFAPDCSWQAFLATIYTTGLRVREAMNLTWQDIDFGEGQLHVTRKSSQGYVQAWTPKDHEMRSIPLPKEAIAILATWQTVALEKCPYVFMEQGRWDYYRKQVDDGQWDKDKDLVNNLLRRFKTICRKAGVGSYTIHDLRRSCITNWARNLPIHVAKQLAGHSDIKTTQQFYLSVQPDDLSKAKVIQSKMLKKIPKADPTDPLLTHSGKKRVFPGMQGCRAKRKALD